jgi:AraC-like DNA-binding protein
MQLANWSSGRLRGGEALKQWREVIEQSLYHLEINASDADFGAVIRQGRLGPALVSELKAGPQRVRHTSRFAGPHMLDLIQIRQGTFRFEQNGRDGMLVPGDCILFDRASPYMFEADVSDALTLSVPHEWLAKWSPDPTDLVARRIDGSSGWGSALSAVISQLDIDGLDEIVVPGGVVAEQIASLLVLACGQKHGETRASRRLLERAREVVRDYAHDPNLTPATAAAALGISKRYLHVIFANAGTSFGRELIAARLERAHAMLSDPGLRSVSIGEIGFRCGFLDQGHFCKRFRARFEMSPSALRTAVHS